jgi:3-mercaptopyruvate sulfurtransferase SseA
MGKAGLFCGKIEKTRLCFGNFLIEIQTRTVQNKGKFLENMNTKEAVLIDARSEDRFLGKRKP